MTVEATGRQSRDITVPAGWVLNRFESVGSTNDIAKDLAANGAHHGTVIVADRQVAGRGRQGRSWSSPVGNLYVSVVLRPAVDPRSIAQLSLVASLAMAEALDSLAPRLDVRVKWPNDVLIGEAKIAGLLLESAGALGKGVEWVVVGSGVNIAHRPELDRPTTSLSEQGAVQVTASDVLEAYLRRLDASVVFWSAGGFPAIRPLWLNYALGVGSPVSVRMGEHVVSGSFADLDETGAVILELRDGARRTIAAGDLVLGG